MVGEQPLLQAPGKVPGTALVQGCRTVCDPTETCTRRTVAQAHVEQPWVRTLQAMRNQSFGRPARPRTGAEQRGVNQELSTPAPRRRRSRRTTTPVRRTAARGQGPRHGRAYRSTRLLRPDSPRLPSPRPSHPVPADLLAAPVRGAWWPRSDDLPAELPALSRAFDRSWGRVTRMAAPRSAWPQAPCELPVAGHPVRTAWFASGFDRPPFGSSPVASDAGTC
ncbi:DUF5994 family protein [Streptomyces chartreusis]|uniref:DUF5994 family protein n=2 Tax=Streptomyces chartreusis TaxID=1969 RepID=UPI0039994C39